MLKFISTFLCVLLAGLSSVNAECPNYTAFENLQLEAFKGTWQVHGLIRSNATDPGIKCLQIELTTNYTTDPASVTAHVHGNYIEDDSFYMQHIEGTVPNANETARWTVAINGTTFEHVVIHTDYQQYALSVTCTAITETVNSYIALIQSRDHDEIPANVLDAYKTVLDMYQIDVGNYVSIPHSHDLCHDH